MPGGPRSAFDKHIGHYQHFTADTLHAVLTEGGLDVDRVLRTGFPFFNLYKLAVMARGEKLVARLRSSGAREPALEGRADAGDRILPARLPAQPRRLAARLAAGALAHVPAAGHRRGR